MIITPCIDRLLPLDLWGLAHERAIAENPANGSPLEAAVITTKLWRPGRILRIHFLDGTSALHAKVIAYAQQWLAHANLSFAFGADPDAEIRISFAQAGNWSAIGADALLIPQPEPTMNFGEFNPALVDPAHTTEERYAAVILHEFGHALGLIHEHQLPAGGIEWNRPAVIAALSGPPNFWSIDLIEANIFERYSVDVSQFPGGFDPQSIMLYAFPSTWTRNGIATRQNSALSAADQSFIAACYPPPKAAT